MPHFPKLAEKVFLKPAYPVQPFKAGFHSLGGGGRVVRRCCVSYITGASNILAYSWARPAILVVGKGRGGMFLFLLFLTFIPVPLSSLSLSFISSTLSSISFLPFSGRRQNDPQGLTCC